MKKVLRTVIPFLVAFSAVTLSGCGNNGGTTVTSSVEPAPGDKVQVDSISLNRLNVSLALSKGENDKLVGESVQLIAETLPRASVAATIVYSSSDSSVASVDATGKVTALKAGNAIISAKSFDGKVETKCNVFVYENSTKTAANKVANKIKTAQTEQGIAASIDKMLTRELLTSYTTKDGILQSLDSYDQYMYVGKSDAFLRLGAKGEKEIKVEGGSASFTDWEWVIYTTASYDTYLFHTIGNTKTYMVADSTSYVGQSRFTALCAILDSLFVSGSGIISKGFSNVLGKDELGYIASSTKRGSNKDDELFVSMDVTYKNQTADAADESDLYIPAGTKYDIRIGHDIIMEENVLYSDKGVQEISYTLNNAKYVQGYDFEYEYHTKGVEFEYPNKDNYALVDDIFSL